MAQGSVSSSCTGEKTRVSVLMMTSIVAILVHVFSNFSLKTRLCLVFS